MIEICGKLDKTPTNITKRTNNETTSHTGKYSIPCKDCNKLYIGETQRHIAKRIYEYKRSIKTNDDRNDVLELKHTFKFSQVTLIKPIHRKKIPKTTRICGNLQNKPYKTTSRFLPNFTMPGEHHTERKQNQNWKRIKKNIFSLCASILSKILLAFPDHLLLSPFPPQSQPRYHK